MNEFQYRARNKAGLMVEGSIRAADRPDAQRQLENSDLIPVEIRAGGGSRRAELSRPGGRVKLPAIIVFTRQLSTMLNAGMPIVQSLQVLKKQAAGATLRQILDRVENRISGGSRLSEALAEFPKAFPAEYVHMVVSGEAGGDLVQSLQRTADWLEREVEIRAEVRAAVRYPLTVFVVLILAALLMAWKVIPQFAKFYERFRVELPLPTRMLIATNAFLQDYGLWLLAAIVVLVVGTGFMLRVPAVRLRYDRLKFQLPLAGAMYGKIVMSRFARVFAMLIRNGVPVLSALEIAPDVVSNLHLRESVRKATQSIKGGDSIFESFDRVPIFPPLMTSLMAVGEKTGSLDQMLDFVVSQYETDIRYSLKNLTGSIEPVVTIVVGVAVLFFALAVYLPIWNLSQTVIR